MLKESIPVLPPSFPAGIPSRRPHGHHNLLLPGRLPSKPSLCRMLPDQLTVHKQELHKVLANEQTGDGLVVGPTDSSICAPTIVIEKHDDSSSRCQRPLVFNSHELKALICHDVLLPLVQTILEMLGKFHTSLHWRSKHGFTKTGVLVKTGAKLSFIRSWACLNIWFGHMG